MRPVLTLLACLAASAGLTSPIAAQPKAAPGEPPFVEVVIRPSLKEYQQTFNAPDMAIGTITLSVARLYTSLGAGGSLPAATVRVRCEILPDGRVLGSMCNHAPGVSEDGIYLLNFAQMAGALPDLKGYGAWTPETGPDWVKRRFVEYNLLLPAITVPQVDLTSGELVAQQLVKAPRERVAGEYPSRALRAEVEGVANMECQIQSDLSIICVDRSFEPPENQEYFKSSPRRTFGGVRSAPTLTDGRDARGKRFIVRLVYRLPPR